MTVKVEVHITEIHAMRREIEEVKSTTVDTALTLVRAERSETAIKAEFKFTTQYAPEIAHLDLSGLAVITGDSGELESIYERICLKKPLPPAVMQVIANVAFATAMLLAYNLNVPLPVPLPQVPGEE